MIHPQIAAALASLPVPPPGPIDPAFLRAAEEAQVPAPETRTPLFDVRDAVASTQAGEVPIRLYTPDASPTRGLLVYIHGGAFFLGSLETHDQLARQLAAATGLTVVAVGYRRAPEAPFPASIEDCYGVVRWVSEHGDEFGWDYGTLAIGGDSSGGNLAAAVCGLACDDGFERITHQVLLYPSLDLRFDPALYPSLTENANGYGLETALLKPFNSFYLASGADPEDPRVSPILRRDLEGLPSALILTAEHDPLRDEGELYGRRLGEADVAVRVVRYEGANHGFIQNFAWLPEYAAAFDEIAAFLAEEGTR